MALPQAAAGRIRDILAGRIVVVGVGNRLRGDDAAGPLLVDRLRESPGLVCIDAGSALENHLGKILAQRPDTVLVVDAAHLEGTPGDYELLEPGRIEERGVSTHDVALKLSLEVLTQGLREQGSGGKVYLLGVQPRSVRFGAGVSEEVRRSIGVLARGISEAAAPKGACGAVTSGVRARPHRME